MNWLNLWYLLVKFSSAVTGDGKKTLFSKKSEKIINYKSSL